MKISTLDFQKEKPALDRDCLLMSMVNIDDQRIIQLWEIQRTENEGEYYFGICYPDGEEWGDWNDFTADGYLFIDLEEGI